MKIDSPAPKDIDDYIARFPTDDPNYVIIHLAFDDLPRAQQMLAALEKLWGKVEGTVMVGPQTRMLEQVESVEV